MEAFRPVNGYMTHCVHWLISLSSNEDLLQQKATDQTNDGFYVEGAYLVPLDKWGDIEFAARYQSYTPDKDYTDPDEKQTSIGVNYYIRKHAVKVQGTYNFNEKDNDHDYDPGDNFVLQLQFAW